MIKKIKIENFRGIYNSRSISFLANAKRVKNKTGVTIKNNKEILLVNSLLGKNASGKTSFINGISFLDYLLTGMLYKKAVNFLEKREKREKWKNKESEYLKINLKIEDVMNLLLKNDFNDRNKPLKFFIEFIDSKSIIGLSLELNKKGMIKEIITNNGEIILKRSVDIENFKSKVFDIKFKKVPFSSSVTIFDEAFGRRNFDWDKILKKISKEKILDWIRIADENIEKILWTSKNQIEGYIIRVNDIQKNIGNSELSSGTKKWLAIGFAVFNSFFIKQCFLYIDEIDRSLHPFLLNFLVTMFSDLKINKKRSQLFFTSHSPLSVDKPFRKDAINFVNELGEIINIGKLKIREDLNITKNFVSEKLCSHPYKSNMFEWVKGFYE